MAHESARLRCASGAAIFVSNKLGLYGSSGTACSQLYIQLLNDRRRSASAWRKLSWVVRGVPGCPKPPSSPLSLLPRLSVFTLPYTRRCGDHYRRTRMAWTVGRSRHLPITDCLCRFRSSGPAFFDGVPEACTTRSLDRPSRHQASASGCERGGRESTANRHRRDGLASQMPCLLEAKCAQTVESIGHSSLRRGQPLFRSSRSSSFAPSPYIPPPGWEIHNRQLAWSRTTSHWPYRDVRLLSHALHLSLCACSSPGCHGAGPR